MVERMKLAAIEVRSTSRFLIPETSILRIRWDMIQFFVLIYVALSVPTRIGFSVEAEGPFYSIEMLIEVSERRCLRLPMTAATTRGPVHALVDFRHIPRPCLTRVSGVGRPQLYFWIDIGFNFFTSYVDDDRIIVTDLKKIRARYLKTWFFIDIVSGALPHPLPAPTRVRPTPQRPEADPKGYRERSDAAGSAAAPGRACC